MPQRATCIWGASCVSGVSGASGVSALCVQWNSEIHGNGAYQAYQAYQTYQLCARSGIMRHVEMVCIRRIRRIGRISFVCAL